MRERHYNYTALQGIVEGTVFISVALRASCAKFFCKTGVLGTPMSGAVISDKCHYLARVFFVSNNCLTSEPPGFRILHNQRVKG